MTVYITDDCINCGACEPECPTGAISEGQDIYVIDPDLCAECYGFYEHHACQSVCPVDCCVLDPTRPETPDTLKERAARLDASAVGRWSATQGEDWRSKRSEALHAHAPGSPARRSWADAAAASEAEHRAAVAGSREKLDRLRGSTEAIKWRSLIEQTARIRGGLTELAPEILAAAPDACFVAVVAALQSTAGSEVVAPEARLRAVQLAYAAKDRGVALELVADLPPAHLAEVARTTPGLLRQAIARKLKAPIADAARWQLALLAAERGYERELRLALALLAAGRPRLWRHENKSRLSKASPLVRDVLDAVIAEAPSGSEMVKRAGVRRIRGSTRLYVEETDELVDSLDETGWDPDDPAHRKAEAARMIRSLPYAHVASGTAKPRRRNALNNPGVDWEVRWSEKTRTATVTLHIAGDDFPENIKRVASMAEAVALAKERATEAQANIDDNSVW